MKRSIAGLLGLLAVLAFGLAGTASAAPSTDRCGNCWGFAGAPTVPAAPKTAAPIKSATASTALPTPDLVTCSTDEGPVQYKLDGAGNAMPANTPESLYYVRVYVTTRMYDGCHTGLPSRIDAAVAIYNNVGTHSVQTDAVWVYANNGTPRTSTCFGCPDNELTRAFAYTPQICVSPFGTGGYYAVSQISYRLNTGALVKRTLTSAIGPKRYATIAC